MACLKEFQEIIFHFCGIVAQLFFEPRRHNGTVDHRETPCISVSPCLRGSIYIFCLFFLNHKDTEARRHGDTGIVFTDVRSSVVYLLLH